MKLNEEQCSILLNLIKQETENFQDLGFISGFAGVCRKLWSIDGELHDMYTDWVLHGAKPEEANVELSNAQVIMDEVNP